MTPVQVDELQLLATSLRLVSCFVSLQSLLHLVLRCRKAVINTEGDILRKVRDEGI